MAAELVSASLMNTHVRDDLLAVTTWTDYTPVWSTTGSAPTLGNATIAGRYISAGGLVKFRVRFVFGSTSAVGTGNFRFTVPVTSVALTVPAEFVGKIIDTGTTHYPAIGQLATTTLFEVFHTTAVNTGIGAGVPITWATGDEINICGTYEAA